MTPIRNLRVVHVLETWQGGIETILRDLLSSQKEDPAIAEIHLVADRTKLPANLELDGLSVHHYVSSRSRLRLVSTAWKVRVLLKTLSPSIVYLHSTFPGVYGRLLTGSRPEWKVVYCSHGWSFNQIISPLRRIIYCAVERWLSRRQDAIVHISFAELASARRAGIHPRFDTVIHHGVKPRRLERRPGEFAAADPDKLNLGFVGRFDRQKGLDLLLQALGDARLSHIHAWLIGTPVIDSVRVDIVSQVSILGWIPNEYIDDYIDCFDAVIIPSLWEGFGLVALEAMRNGKPVLASNVGGLSELVIHGWNGYLFEPESAAAIRELLLGLDKSKLRQMGQAALAVSEAFQWVDCYARWRDLMLSLTADADRPQ